MFEDMAWYVHTHTGDQHCPETASVLVVGFGCASQTLMYFYMMFAAAVILAIIAGRFLKSVAIRCVVAKAFIRVARNRVLYFVDQYLHPALDHNT